MSDPERVVVRLRSHGRALVLPAVLLCGIAFGAAFAVGRVDWPFWDALVLTLAIVLAVVLCLMPALAWLSRRVVVTSRRVIVRSAFGGARRDVPFARIHDVAVRRHGIQRVLGSGDVLLSTGGSQPVTLADLPSASLVQRTLTDLVAQTPTAVGVAGSRLEDPA